MHRIDLNADLGEGGTADAELMTIVSSCNIACGGHAGDPGTMTSTLRLARVHGVAAGAHPSYPDRDGFGRRPRFMAGRALFRSLHDQIGRLAELASSLDSPLRHLKPHGALYHDANAYPELSTMLANLANAFELRLVGPPAGALRAASQDSGVGYIAEGFVDRAYTADGGLLPRDQAGAVFDREDRAVRQALSIAGHQRVTTHDGNEITLSVDTLCLHGDTPGAVDMARAVRSALRLVDVVIGTHRLLQKDIASTHRRMSILSAPRCSRAAFRFRPACRDTGTLARG